MSRALRFSSCCALLTVVWFSLAVSASSAQTTLRWKFQEGQKFKQVVQQDMKMAMKVGERDITTQMKQTMDVIWTVGQVDADGVSTVEQQFTHMRMKMDAPGGIGFEFDSDKEQELTGVGAMIAPALKALAQSKFTMKMTNRGEVKEVEVTPETVEAFKKLPGTGQMGGTFSKDGLINMIKQGANAFPEGPVDVGDDWSNEASIEVPQIGKLETVTKLTYAGQEVVDGKSLERVNIDVAVKVTPKEDEEPALPMTIKDQKGSGYLLFDNAAGRLSHSNLVQNMTMEISVGGTALNQKIEQTMTTRLTPAEQ